MAETAERAKRVRTTVTLPTSLHQALQEAADEREVSLNELFREAASLLLLMTKARKSPDCSVILREGNKERELIIV